MTWVLAMKTTAQKRKRRTGSQPPTRVSRACDRCRGRKYKCDGSRPCLTCSAAGQPCVYDPNSRKRGLVEGYVRGLERLLGLAVSSDPNFEPLVTSVMNHHLDSKDALKSPAHGWAIDHDAETMLESWKKSKISQDIQALIPALEALEANGRWRKPAEGFNNGSAIDETLDIVDVSIDPPVDVSDRGETIYMESEAPDSIVSDFDTRTLAPTGLAHDPTIEVALLEPNPNAQSSHAFEELLSKRVLLPESQQQSLLDVQTPLSQAEITSLRHSVTVPHTLPKRATELIHYYFRFSHCWLPIFERYDVQRLSYQYGRRCQNMTAASKGSGEIAALWAILAYEDSFQQHETNREGAKESENSTSGPESLYAVARSLVPPEGAHYELGHIQALLLLALFNTRQAQWSAAWLLVGHASRIAVDMGLNVSPVSVGEWLSSRKLHVFLGCFALETFLSARLERRPLLRGDALDHLCLLEEGGADEWEPWRGSIDNALDASCGHPGSPSFITSTFNLTVRVLRVLNDVLCEPCRESEGRERIDDYQRQLSRIAEESRERYPTDWTQYPMPHQALFSLMHTSVSNLIRSRFLRQHFAPADFPNVPLTSHFTQCCKAFGARRIPPLAEHSAFLSLLCLQAVPNRHQVLAALEDLYSFALTGSGTAFQQLQERIQAQKDFLRGEPGPRLHRLDHEVERTEGSSASGFDTIIAGKDDRSIDNGQNLDAVTIHNDSNDGLHTQAQLPDDLMGAAQGRLPLAAPALPPIDSRSSYGARGVNEAWNAQLQPAPETSSIDPVSRTGTTPALADEDAVFYGLAHLDTTKW